MNTIDIFGDENATASEKVGALISTLSTIIFLIPQMAEVIKTVAGALKTSTGIVGIVIVVIEALVAAISIFIRHKEKERQAVIDHAKEVRKENEELQENIKNVKSLSKEVEDLAESYEKAKEAGEDVTDIYKNLTEKLDSVRENYEKIGISSVTLDMLDQAAAVALATNNWDEYARIQRKAGREENVKKKERAEEQINSSIEAIKNTEGFKYDENTKKGQSNGVFV